MAEAATDNIVPPKRLLLKIKHRDKLFKVAVKRIDKAKCSPLSVVHEVKRVDERSQKNISSVVKAPDVNTTRFPFIGRWYQCEIFFYSQIYTRLKTFEKQHKVVESLIPVPDYLASNNNIGKEMITLENLKTKKFTMIKSTLNEDHCRVIFETYGQFHAVSFCWKNQNQSAFKCITDKLKDFMKGEQEEICINKDHLPTILKEILDMLTQRNLNHLTQKLEPYLQNFKEIFNSAEKYEADNSDSHCILHGFCKLNNMMFKYHKETQKVEAANLLSFCFTKFGLPIKDLLYFFYQELEQTSLFLNKCHSFLDSYYESFSTIFKIFGQDSSLFYPKHKLFEQWKVLAKSCMLIALSFQRDTIERTYAEEGENKIYSKENTQVCNLLQHMYDNDLL